MMTTSTSLMMAAKFARVSRVSKIWYDILMLTHHIKRPFFKQLILNFQLWHFWHKQKKEGDVLAIKICKMYSFWSFMKMDLFWVSREPTLWYDVLINHPIRKKPKCLRPPSPTPPPPASLPTIIMAFLMLKPSASLLRWALLSRSEFQRNAWTYLRPCPCVSFTS